MQTNTQLDYNSLSTIILDIYKSKPNPNLRRYESFMYAAQAFLKPLPGYFTSLEASRTWLFFWNTLTIKVLGGSLDEECSQRLVHSLEKLQYNKNDMQGWLGNDYIPHLASTYAAVHAICHIGTPEAYHLINIQKLLTYFVAVKSDCGGFLMHIDGELDVRGTYCVLSCLDLLQVHKNPTYHDTMAVLLRHSLQFLANCQTHQGGFGSMPGLEAHGGYTHCAVMSLFILQKWSQESELISFEMANLINVKLLKKWCALRVDWSGGLSGRSNKLVDVCYSYWVGSLLVLLNVFPTATPLDHLDSLSNLYPNVTIHDRLQLYVSMISASPIRDQASANYIAQGGGFRDKPNKGADYYHTGYGLSGWSILQNNATKMNLMTTKIEDTLEKISIFHNCVEANVLKMQQYFTISK